MTIMNIINACATELAKNATTDPMLALSAFPKSKSCTNSTMSTAIKGTMIIPNGGMTKHPTITPINAAYSPNLEPPKRFTKYLSLIHI